MSIPPFSSLIRFAALLVQVEGFLSEMGIDSIAIVLFNGRDHYWALVPSAPLSTSSESFKDALDQFGTS